MGATAIRDLLERDKSIVELRSLLTSYEQRLSGSSDKTPDCHPAGAYVPEPLFLLNDIAVDLRSSALESYSVIEAPAILDCNEAEEPRPFSLVYKIASGVFRVHPQPGKPSTAAIGPFAGPVPTAVVATAQTTHEAAPSVRFHISTWIGEFASSAVQDKFASVVHESRFLTVPPRHPGLLISTTEAQALPDAPWGLLLATIADPPDEVGYAWAEFSDIVLLFSSDRGCEVRRLL